MVQTLIAERYKVKLGHSSVCWLLHQLGLSAQRPLWRAYQQNPEAVKQWLETDYPAIRRRARHAGAQIFFADEAGVRSDFHSGTTWGRPPPPDRVRSLPRAKAGGRLSLGQAAGGRRWFPAPARGSAPT
jgi:Winged helix-turn helix